MQGRTWIWLGIFGSLLFFIGGLANVIKVFKMEQIDGLRMLRNCGEGHMTDLSMKGKAEYPSS